MLIPLLMTLSLAQPVDWNHQQRQQELFNQQIYELNQERRHQEQLYQQQQHEYREQQRFQQERFDRRMEQMRQERLDYYGY